MLDRTRWPVGIYNLPPRTGTLTDVEDSDSDFFGLSILEVRNSKHKFICPNSD